MLALWPSLFIVGEEDQPGVTTLSSNLDSRYTGPAVTQTLSIVPADVMQFYNNKITTPVQYKQCDITDICMYVMFTTVTQQVCTSIRLTQPRSSQMGLLSALLHWWALDTEVYVVMMTSSSGAPVAGVVGFPFQHCILYGMDGVGVVGLDAKPARCHGNTDGVVIVTSSYHTDATSDAYTTSLSDLLSSNANPDIVALLTKLHKKPSTSIVRAGGCGNKCILVLQGDVDVYVHARPGTKKWDTCAPHALLKIVGGDIRTPDGRPLTCECVC